METGDDRHTEFFPYLNPGGEYAYPGNYTHVNPGPMSADDIYTHAGDNITPGFYAIAVIVGYLTDFMSRVKEH